MLAQNPVLPGFYPDPSVCRVGDTYYLVASSFGYFPGIPIFTSNNLVHWEQIGHVLTESNWMDFTGLQLSDGVWAPTIRWADGRFIVLYSVSHGVSGMRTYVVTASHARGPWSQPKDLNVVGFDPSLFVDDDGRYWLTACKDRTPRVEGAPGCLWLRELDPITLDVIGEEVDLWSGALRGAWVEAPRIFKKDETYWLVAAEGGTERGHAVTVARAENIQGPYCGDNRNPLLTHRHLDPEWPIQNVGHVDIVETPDGVPWAMALAVRPIRGHHTLGREPFLIPMKWTRNGPVFAPDSGRVEPAFEMDGLENATETGARQVGFVSADTQSWITPFSPLQFNVAGKRIEIFAERRVNLEPLNSAVLRRQTGQAFEFEAVLPVPEVHDSISIFLMQNPQRFMEMKVSGQNVNVIQLNVKGESGEVLATITDAHEALDDSRRVRFVCDTATNNYEAQIRRGDSWVTVSVVDRAFLSTETAGGFVGVVMGLNCDVLIPKKVSFEFVEYRNLVG